jgi:hypothetical protein
MDDDDFRLGMDIPFIHQVVRCMDSAHTILRLSGEGMRFSWRTPCLSSQKRINRAIPFVVRSWRSREARSGCLFVCYDGG